MSCTKSESQTGGEDKSVHRCPWKGCQPSRSAGKGSPIFPSYRHQQQITLQSEFMRNLRNIVLFCKGNSHEYSSDYQESLPTRWLIGAIIECAQRRVEPSISSSAIRWLERTINPFRWTKQNVRVDGNATVCSCHWLHTNGWYSECIVKLSKCKLLVAVCSTKGFPHNDDH